MRIGQIVYISAKAKEWLSHFKDIESGIIAKKEYDKDTDTWWYEVLCNDNKNHVMPGFLLSPGQSTWVAVGREKINKKCKKDSNIVPNLHSPH